MGHGGHGPALRAAPLRGPGGGCTPKACGSSQMAAFFLIVPPQDVLTSRGCGPVTLSRELQTRVVSKIPSSPGHFCLLGDNVAPVEGMWAIHTAPTSLYSRVVCLKAHIPNTCPHCCPQTPVVLRPEQTPPGHRGSQWGPSHLAPGCPRGPHAPDGGHVRLLVLALEHMVGRAEHGTAGQSITWVLAVSAQSGETRVGQSPELILLEGPAQLV